MHIKHFCTKSVEYVYRKDEAEIVLVSLQHLSGELIAPPINYSTFGRSGYYLIITPCKVKPTGIKGKFVYHSHNQSIAYFWKKSKNFDTNKFQELFVSLKTRESKIEEIVKRYLSLYTSIYLYPDNWNKNKSLVQ